MSEEKNERQQTEELASRVANLVTGEQVFEHITKVQHELMGDIRRAVLRGATESLLMYRGLVARARDAEWSRVMAAIWLPSGMEDAQVPTDPYQLQSVIMAWQSDRERQVAQEKFREGIQSIYSSAYVAGTKFGWGAASIGKSMDEVLKVASREKPVL